jgi:hypothetical protein
VAKSGRVGSKNSSKGKTSKAMILFDIRGAEYRVLSAPKI